MYIQIVLFGELLFLSVAVALCFLGANILLQQRLTMVPGARYTERVKRVDRGVCETGDGDRP